jgi:hypothetical protein
MVLPAPLRAPHPRCRRQLSLEDVLVDQLTVSLAMVLAADDNWDDVRALYVPRASPLLAAALRGTLPAGLAPFPFPAARASQHIHTSTRTDRQMVASLPTLPRTPPHRIPLGPFCTAW